MKSISKLVCRIFFLILFAIFFIGLPILHPILLLAQDSIDFIEPSDNLILATPQTGQTNQNLSNFLSPISATGSLSNTSSPIFGWSQFEFGTSYESVVSNFRTYQPSLKLVAPTFPEFEDTINYYYLTTYKNTFYQKVDFQFNLDKELYLIRLTMNPRFFSFLKLYQSLYLRYGPPASNEFKRITWHDDQNYITLTRESVITYYSELFASSDTQLPNQSTLNPEEKIEEIIQGL